MARIGFLECLQNTRASLLSESSWLTIGIELSISKIQKILVSGGCWTTARSREVQALYYKYIRSMDSKTAVKRIAKDLEISAVSVNVNLPYGKVIYGLENKSGNAKRIERGRRKKGSY